MKFADVIVPFGRQNNQAIDLIVMNLTLHIQESRIDGKNLMFLRKPSISKEQKEHPFQLAFELEYTSFNFLTTVLPIDSPKLTKVQQLYTELLNPAISKTVTE